MDNTNHSYSHRKYQLQRYLEKHSICQSNNTGFFSVPFHVFSSNVFERFLLDLFDLVENVFLSLFFANHTAIVVRVFEIRVQLVIPQLVADQHFDVRFARIIFQVLRQNRCKTAVVGVTLCEKCFEDVIFENGQLESNKST